MLFLSLGTDLGSTMIVDGILEAMEMGHLPYRKGTYDDYVGERGLERLGLKKWRRYVVDVVARLSTALEPGYVVLGGGGVHKLKDQCPRVAGQAGNANVVPRRISPLGGGLANGGFVATALKDKQTSGKAIS